MNAYVSSKITRRNVCLFLAVVMCLSLIPLHYFGAENVSASPQELAEGASVTCTEPAWNSSQVYVGGDKVSHNGHEWRAKWWTQGEEPGTTGQWGVWEDLGPCEEEDPVPVDPPAAPTGLTANAGDGRVGLNWNEVSDAEEYKVKRSTTSGGSYTTIATVTSSRYTDRSVQNGTTYYYVVSAVNSAGESSNSEQVSATPQEGTYEPGENRMVGYFTQWGIYGRDFLIRDVKESGMAERLTHINYAFGNVSEDGECFIVNQTGVGDAWADYQRGFRADESVDGVADTWDQQLKGNFNQLRKLKEMYPDLRVYISLGGWTWSKNFSDAALTPESRERFVRSCVDLYLRGDLPVQGGDPAGGPGAAFGVFDGIDLDWEWPGSEGHEHNIVRPEDKENFTELVKEFRRQLDELEQEVGREYDLTAFVPADPKKIDAGFEVDKIMPHFDFVTVQGYDLAGAWEPMTNHQSNIYDAPGDPSDDIWSIDTTIQAYIDRGAPRDKLVLGVPYYGRGWTGVPSGPNGDGLFQTASGAAPGTWENGIEDYKVLKNRPGQRFRDEETGALWLYDGTEWWTYDDPQLLEQKMEYVKEQSLGGAMIWSLDGDTSDGELTRALYDALNN